MSRPRGLLLVNSKLSSVGRLGRALSRLDITEVRPHEGQDVPALGGFQALIVLGGPMGAYDTDEYPALLDEMELIRQAVSRDVPTLGICLGSQLIARALGGDAYLAEQPEAGVVSLVRTPAGLLDPVIGEFEGPTLVCHRDTFTLPPDAILLAESAMYPQVFRLGSALAIQSHPEATTETARRWTQAEGELQIVADSGLTTDEFLGQSAEHEVELSRQAHDLFDRWVDDLLEPIELTA